MVPEMVAEADRKAKSLPILAQYVRRHVGCCLNGFDGLDCCKIGLTENVI